MKQTEISIKKNYHLTLGTSIIRRSNAFKFLLPRRVPAVLCVKSVDKEAEGNHVNV